MLTGTAFPAVVTASAVVPRQLPAAPRQFTGRASELETLRTLAGEAVTGDAVVIAAIGGTAGVGKSALERAGHTP